jgi:hypothetical protein
VTSMYVSAMMVNLSAKRFSIKRGCVLARGVTPPTKNSLREQSNAFGIIESLPTNHRKSDAEVGTPRAPSLTSQVTTL